MLEECHLKSNALTTLQPPISLGYAAANVSAAWGAKSIDAEGAHQESMKSRLLCESYLDDDHSENFEISTYSVLDCARMRAGIACRFT